MLQERAENRPNIYQVHEMTCRLRGVSVRLENVSPSRLFSSHIRQRLTLGLDAEIRFEVEFVKQSSTTTNSGNHLSPLFRSTSPGRSSDSKHHIFHEARFGFYA